MGNENHPWKNERHSIKCCRECKPPKRYPGCGAKCEEYIQEKAQLEMDRKRMREEKEKTPRVTSYDFDTNAFSRPRRKKQ